MSRGNRNNLKPFEKGHKKFGGRMPGVPNKISRNVKEAVLLAAEAVGFDNRGTDGLVGYVKRIAIEDPKVFAVLLARMMALEGPAPVPHSLDLSKLSDEELRQLEHIISKAQIPMTIVEHAITEIAPIDNSREKPKPNEGLLDENNKPDKQNDG
jgi:hypothetical protein